MTVCDVSVIGAGPYGMSVAAHLRDVKGLEVRVFGEPMSFWETKMPVGMLLRSPWAGSHLSDPHGALTLDAYRKAIGENIVAGPRALATKIIADHTFSRCAVKKLWGWFMKRDMHVLGAESEEAPLLDELATGFESNSYSLPWLIEQVVSQPQYRRIR